MLRIAVIGAGNQGTFHLKSLLSIEQVTVSLVVDRDPAKGSIASRDFQVYSDIAYSSHFADFDAAIIAVPTVDHFVIASELLRAGKHVLIEKPVTSSVAQAEELVHLARTHGVVAHVGFPERFNPAVKSASSRITHPKFVEAHRLGVFSPRSLDIDVVLDLMIHDLDLLYQFLKEEPSGLEAVGIPILSNQVDIANSRLKFPSGCVVNLTASRVSDRKMRKMRLFQPYSYLSLDFAQQAFAQFSLEPNLCNAGFPEIRRFEFQPEHQHHPLVEELIAFRDAVSGKDSAGVSIDQAIPSLRMALAIKSAMQV